MSEHKSRTTAFLERIGVKERDPKELLREWTRELRRSQRMLDRQVREIEREEAKMKRNLQMLAKKGERAAIAPLARALVQSKKAKERIHVSKANLNSVQLELRHQVATLRMAKVMQSSTKVMSAMNGLMKMPQMSAQMRDMALEMEKAGLIDEMLTDGLDMALDNDMLDDEADEEVDQVIAELTLGILNTAPVASSAGVPAPAPAEPARLAATGKQLFVESLSQERVLVAAGGDDPHAQFSAHSQGAAAEVSDLDRRLAALQS